MKSIIYTIVVPLKLTVFYIYCFLYTIPKLFFLRLSGKTFSIEYGSGPVNASMRNGMLTVDRFFCCDLPWDARFPLPFIRKQIKLVYSSHFLEHLNYTQLIAHLSFVRNKLLAYDGVMKLSVPNSSLYINSYASNQTSDLVRLSYKPYYFSTNSLLDQVNYIAYMGGEHKYLFDEENIHNILLQCKFSSSKTRSFEFNLDLPSRHFESIYVEARF